jgi:Peptidase family M28
MRTTRFATLLFLFCTSMLAAQERDTFIPNPNVKPKKRTPKATYELPDPRPFAEQIQVADLQALLSVLTSDSLQGRETGQIGQRKAADFIARQFREAGLQTGGERTGSYFQPITLESTEWEDLGVKVGDQEFKNRQDFYVLHAQIQDAPLTTLKEVVFVGYGIEDPRYNDYGKADVKGKAVIFYDGEPLGKDGKSLITKSETRSEWSLNWRKKAELARAKGAALVFVIDPNLADSMKKNRRQIATYGWTPVGGGTTAVKPTKIANTVFVNQTLANAILGKKAEKIAEEVAEIPANGPMKPIKIKSKIEVRLDKETKRLEGSNVLAVIEGSDPVLKNEYVFITAHYDHLGMSDSTRIFHGADDNGSGTSSVIEIARAFQAAKKQGVGPKRTVVCMLVSGEEKGLLGSEFYVEFPIFPLDKTVVDVNIDMVGRVDPDHANGDYVYVIGSNRLSSELHEINERANATYTNIALEYKYNDPNDPNHYYERSDHYNFAERGIPAIFYFNGTHDDYHKTTDTYEKINFEALRKRAQLAFYTAWDIANRPTALIVDKKKK